MTENMLKVTLILLFYYSYFYKNDKESHNIIWETDQVLRAV